MQATGIICNIQLYTYDCRKKHLKDRQHAATTTWIDIRTINIIYICYGQSRKSLYNFQKIVIFLYHHVQYQKLFGMI